MVKRAIKIIGFSILLGILTGCGTDGIAIVMSGSTHMDLANINVQESTKVPVVSYRSGPYTYTFVNHKLNDYTIDIEGKVSVTNHVTALGIFTSDEHKQLELDVRLERGNSVGSTNQPEEAIK